MVKQEKVFRLIFCKEDIDNLKDIDLNDHVLTFDLSKNNYDKLEISFDDTDDLGLDSLFG
jgi:hypothetical protein